MDQKRKHKLKEFHHLLNTSEGTSLMAELKSAWASSNPIDDSPQHMGFNIGLSEAYKQLEGWRDGTTLGEIDPTPEELS